MNRFLTYNICPLLILLFSITSCVRDVILDAGERPTVVVECILNDSDVQELHLNFTKGASRTEAEPLTEAVATLIDLTNDKTVGQFVKSEGDLWTLNYTAMHEHVYRIEIQVPGYGLIYAEETMPEPIDIFSETREWDVFSSWAPGFDCASWFRGTTFSITTIPEITLIYGMNYNPMTGRHELADEIFTNIPVVDNFNLTGDVYMPELFKASSDRYDMEAAYIDLKGAQKHRQYILIEKQRIMDLIAAYQKEHKGIPYEFIVYGSFTGDWYHYFGNTPREPYPTEGYLVFLSLSDNYNKYLRDAIHFQQIKESTDMSAIYLRDNIHTNIVGGTGIFAAQTKQIQQCANIMSGITMGEYEKYGIDENGNHVQYSE
ncbi:MAG: DUF4249 family protein [Bacteroidales bacterium]|nr:DUF4249 family protein [Bacteroidales bacterium]